MAEGMEKIEIERLMNLVRGFGWEQKSQEMTEDKIIITLTKDRVVSVVPAGAGPG